MILGAALALALSLPADFDRATFCAIARGIFQEAGGDMRKAERIAERRGYHWHTIQLAKRICRATTTP